MSLLCGVYALKRSEPIPDAWIRSLREGISRQNTGKLHEFRDAGIYLLKLDLGLLRGGAWKNTNGSVTALAGDPVLAERTEHTTREHDLATLTTATQDDLRTLLRTSRGNFNLATYEPISQRLTIATDRLGARPIYWLRHGDFLLFSGARRLLYKLPGLAITADITGVMEMVTLGHTIGRYTEFAGISYLQDGRMLTVDTDGISEESYWDWCRDAPQPEAETAELRKALHEAFRRAVRVRLGDTPTVYAALSGGLDSRVVVTALHECGADIHTVNASWDGSLDQILARDYAAALGLTHHEQIMPDDESGDDVVRRCAKLMEQHAPELIRAGGLPTQLWGGNDGGMTVGYAYVNEELVRLQRTAGVDEVARAFLDSMGLAISTRGLKRRWRDLAERNPYESIRDELARLDCRNPAQRIYVFFLLNRPRRMYAPHFEEIDLFPYEQIEPFFDTDFLATACRLPIDESLNHGLYNRWLGEFPPVITSVPWQAYPGHESGPLPLPEQVASQWEISQQRLKPARKCKTLDELDALLRSRDDLSRLLSRPALALMRLGNRLGILDGTWSFEQAVRMAKILRLCEGRAAARNTT